MSDVQVIKFEYHHSRYGDPDFEYQWMLAGNGRIYNYIDPDFDVGSFMGGQYGNLNIFDVGLDRNELDRFLKRFLLDTLYDMRCFITRKS